MMRERATVAQLSPRPIFLQGSRSRGNRLAGDQEEKRQGRGRAEALESFHETLGGDESPEVRRESVASNEDLG